MKALSKFSDESKLTSKILSEQTWKDLEILFGEKGACGGCWCMHPRLSGGIYNENKGEGNKKLFHQLVNKQEPLGILVYDGKLPIAWCSISPKPTLMLMKNSRIMNMTPREDTWSIVCLFIKKEYRKKHLSSFVISKAVEYAFQNGAQLVEAYPLVSKKDKIPDAFAWTGIWKSYKNAGFKKIKQVSETKLIMSISKP